LMKTILAIQLKLIKLISNLLKKILKDLGAKT
jgi:hypothetical protein